MQRIAQLDIMLSIILREWAKSSNSESIEHESGNGLRIFCFRDYTLRKQWFGIHQTSNNDRLNLLGSINFHWYLSIDISNSLYIAYLTLQGKIIFVKKLNWKMNHLTYFKEYVIYGYIINNVFKKPFNIKNL